MNRNVVSFLVGNHMSHFFSTLTVFDTPDLADVDVNDPFSKTRYIPFLIIVYDKHHILCDQKRLHLTSDNVS